MKFPVLFLGMVALAGADPLEDEVADLRAKFEKLEGYQATYEALTQEGKSGTFQVGIDHQSGWAYVIADVNDGEGNETRMEQWSMGGKELVMSQDGDVTIYEGFDNISDRFDELKKLFKNGAEISTRKVRIEAHLTPTAFDMSLGLGVPEPRWFNEVDKLEVIDENEVQFDWLAEGVIRVDRETGVIKSQQIEVEGGKRTMKLVSWKKNPGKEAVSSLMKISVEGATRRNVVELGMGRRILYQLFQQMSEEMGRREMKPGDQDIADAKFENGIIEFLKGEKLDDVLPLADEDLIPMIEDIVENSKKFFADEGLNVKGDAALRTPVLRDQLETRFAEAGVKSLDEPARQAFATAILGGRLNAKGFKQMVAREEVENFLLKCFFRMKMRKAIENYLK